MRHSSEPHAPLFSPFAGLVESLRATIPPVDPNAHPDDRPRLSGQNAALLDWLRTGERVTFREAEARGIHRLAARVFDLRRAGYAVKSERDAARACEVYWLETKGGG